MKKLMIAWALLVSLNASAEIVPQAAAPLPDEADCQLHASAIGKLRDPDFIRVTLDTPMDAERYDAKAGRQHIATVYKGSALYEGKPGSRRLQFICLHGGSRSGVVFLDYLPVSIETPDLIRHNQYENWVCRQRGALRVTYNSVADQVYLRHDGRDQVLDHTVSASGVRFQNAQLIWWGKGRTAALYQRDGKRERVLDVCRLQGVLKP